MIKFGLAAALTAWVVFAPVLCAAQRPQNGSEMTDALRRMVETDWAGQEQRQGRRPSDAAAIDAALARTRRLLADHLEMGLDLAAEEVFLGHLASQAGALETLDESKRTDLYLRIRRLARTLALDNPLVTGRRLAFLKRRRFICQMLHEYNGYYYDYGDIAGGGVYVLTSPGRSLEVTDLIKGRLPKGNYSTLSLSHDGKTLYFAFAKRSAGKPDYAGRNGFHIFAMHPDGGGLRQLTDGPFDDFDPCPLPDGGLAFMSSRRGGFCRCNNPWEPLSTYNLHRMNVDGTGIRTLSFHETNEWHPSVLNDGRIVYIRWDYVDRSAAHYHGLWVSNPDGTNPAALFGNYTQNINACYQPRAVPGSTKIAFLAGAHHADVGGSLILLDPARAGLDAVTGQDRFDALEVLTPEVCFPEAPGWPKTWYHSPWPLSENYFLVAYSREPLPGMGPNIDKDTRTGLYYFDRFGNLELLYEDEDISCMYPIPLAARPMPPVVPSELDERLGDEGEFFVGDVRMSHFPLPADRPVTALRIYQVLPKAPNHIANEPRIGYPNADSARMLLGSVPVEADGSAYFRAPARKPIYFQAVDAAGRAVQTMRSVTYLQPGERRGCVGCHEPRNASLEMTARPMAMKRAASVIEPGPEGTLPFSFPLLVQPVLDRNCVSCHDGSTGSGKSAPDLTGAADGTFTKAYKSLRRYVRWYEWGGETIRPIVTKPGESGADMSRLSKIIGDAAHREHVQLAPEDAERLNIWLDGNVPFYGTYEPEAHRAQLAGEAVPPPVLQ
ncbi:MAG: hypothetical protein IH624_08525 [Phycisphaerae bacterium]|nr:hypothetical protein [Phycisphaerae bacterium]